MNNPIIICTFVSPAEYTNMPVNVRNIVRVTKDVPKYALVFQLISGIYMHWRFTCIKDMEDCLLLVENAIDETKN